MKCVEKAFETVCRVDCRVLQDEKVKVSNSIYITAPVNLNTSRIVLVCKRRAFLQLSNAGTALTEPKVGEPSWWTTNRSLRRGIQSRNFLRSSD